MVRRTSETSFRIQTAPVKQVNMLTFFAIGTLMKMTQLLNLRGCDAVV